MSKLNYVEQTFKDNLSNYEEDDETFDKSATLKASANTANAFENNLSPMDASVVANNLDRKMDRFNSEKSIYYSSVSNPNINHLLLNSYKTMMHKITLDLRYLRYKKSF